MKEFLKNLKLFFKGALLDSATDKLEYKAKVLNDNLLTVVLSHRLGIPNPVHYYLVELLPHIAVEIKGWERRMADRKSVISRALGEVGEP
ncbi:hypothetical protein [Phorcysia thermohydrogeniphila]|uniref:Uncharacterized protein n=1 Tax=Phorcysia thermohydrogeniphila TaxID=936138 RepID=A0A4V2PDV9_9BACT|nr:hypothetical protein [Phorcysia thermohydrogeniphila]TCK06556.1 hypothetical protein CLV27_0358 [Phorcysia thermohydrogeniphila]